MSSLSAYAKLGALAVFTRLPDQLSGAILRPFARWIWPRHPEAERALRALATELAPGSTEP